MKYEEAKKLKREVFLPLVAENLEGEDLLIMKVFVAPNDENLRQSFITWMESENTIAEANDLGVSPDERTYFATGYNKYPDDYTIMIRTYNPIDSKSETILASKFPGIENIIEEGVLSRL